MIEILCVFETKTQWLVGFYTHIVTRKVQLFSKHSSRIWFSSHIFISNANIQASRTFVSAATVVAERHTRLCPLSSPSPRSLFIPAASSHLCCLRSDTWGGNGSDPRCVSFTVTAGWLHRTGRCGVCGVVCGINKTFCTMSMNKFDSLLLSCTFTTIFASVRALTLGCNCETCWIYPFGTGLQAGLGLEAA